ncbi:MAG TPA: 16S rRNA (guanine(966)-N(2))-methyltransferase RsmD [Rudaea sp.]
MPRPDARAIAGKLRIIGGSLRGSRLAVADAPGLRPTPDRVRETLFNWLMPVIDGARCLDLFAGTGALGIEALSRGAAWTDFVETEPRLAQALRENLQRLKQARAAVFGGDALTLLGSPPRVPYDIVFLDPPFSAGRWEEAAGLLEANEWLRDGAMVYLEAPVSTQPVVPPSWSLHRESTAGAVRFALYRHPNASAKL